ncbi:hypothetical protein A2926_00995 [Candidatus Giovannonibacteria bacterium RIFCSPLOWO2_01_FULL_44_40]|uniref:Putative 3-methyladenine DNA glycosylase n=1 Tax=Candidatus Giovannonibacteria bacterium RIFCSPHIGHO2_01_FULL_45_23 TaxID=1798325 RepID=A0A1F5VH03_9BACT|nr:MAG: hypothetical protein A2834_02695 [Candidatus Giovannonibacteria bacterium RIFCSPHIGHO2_01_FULL_45_23]OGF75160.1 MAG: hypothetical protein A3C77_03700 [Candidatus Giovannonibacteria bacterium RIFCSPHIGHO2_02_FULL_45_13]OGF80013.1 MAG: hypothetical protein A2926_00995 [Candidatus Giovannonibacteria bacterium RIFCSPLOWO2_01_FULL_44_40]
MTKNFFERPAVEVARELVGKFLCHRTSLRRRTSKCFMITETEAYVGPRDKASHAHRGRTKRNAPMFGEAGRWYVYFTYGTHWMLNIVTGPKDYPAAVLIRAAADTPSQNNVFADLAQSRHGGTSREIRQQANIRVRKNIIMGRLNGPGKLTKFLKIDKHFNEKPASRAAGLWIAAPSGRASPRAGGFRIKRAARVGVDYAQDWAKKKYRFIMENNEKRNFNDRTRKMGAHQ